MPKSYNTPKRSHIVKTRLDDEEYCKNHFPGHQAIVCTHPDGHNHSGNIHVHIVINSLRIEEVPFMPYMDRPCDTQPGMKHQCCHGILSLRGHGDVPHCRIVSD